MGTADGHAGKESSTLLQRRQTVTKQVHAAVGVQVVDHPATALEVSQIGTRVGGAAEDQTAVVARAAVIQFIARATHQLHLTAQQGHQRVTTGLGQQQIRGPEQLKQLQPPAITTRYIQ